MFLGNHRITSIFLISLVTFTAVGCVNLDKRDPAPFRMGQKTDEGQTFASQGDTKKSVSKMEEFTQSTGFMNAVKKALPFQRKIQKTVTAQPLAQDDPTRLDYMPKDVGPDLYIASAQTSERSGDYDLATQQYQKALQIDGHSRRALIGLARLKTKLGATNEAIQVYRQAIESHPNDAVIMNDLGICYAQGKQLPEAIEALSAATRVAPDREMYANNLAAALVEAGRPEEALSYLNQTRTPQVASYNVGYLLAQSGRKQQATEYLSRALFIDPQLAQARTLLDELSPKLSARP